MSNHEHLAPTSRALFALAEIKTAAEAFDSGDSNVFDTIDAIAMALEYFRATTVDRGRREAA